MWLCVITETDPDPVVEIQIDFCRDKSMEDQKEGEQSEEELLEEAKAIYYDYCLPRLVNFAGVKLQPQNNPAHRAAAECYNRAVRLNHRCKHRGGFISLNDLRKMHKLIKRVETLLYIVAPQYNNR